MTSKDELREKLMKCVAVDLTHIVPNESTFYIHKLLNLLEGEKQKARIEARKQLALEFIEQLDLANVPMEVKIPKIIGESDLTQVSVPVVSGDYWVSVHKALKYMRDATTSVLATLNKEPNKGEDV